MMSVHELFYGEVEPVWIIATAAGQVIHHHPQPKPRQYSTEQNNSPYHKTQQADQSDYQPMAPRSHPEQEMANQRPKNPHCDEQSHGEYQNQHNHHGSQKKSSENSHCDSHRHPEQHMDHQRQINPHHDGESHREHQHHQHNHHVSPKNSSENSHCDSQPHLTHQRQQNPRHDEGTLPENEARQHYEHNWLGRNSYAESEQHASQYNTHQPKAPSQNVYQYNSQQQNSNGYRRPEIKVVKMKVPICCEACEESVIGCLSRLTGVHSVKCDLRKEKVTVTGHGAHADILKACKKLFKHSEMWEDRYIDHDGHLDLLHKIY